MDGSNSFRTMMWCWPESRGGVRVPGASCPRWRPKAAAVALVGNKASVEIGEDQWVVEHEQDTGKLVRVLVGAEGVRCGLPTGVLCAAGVERDGGGEMQLGRSELSTGGSRIECRRWSGVAAREREGVKAPGWPVHGDQEVAAGEQFGDVVACVGEATREEERGRDRRETTRGGCSSWRWSSGGLRRR
jgi:hypothetical protein